MARNKRWKRRAKRYLGEGIKENHIGRVTQCSWCRNIHNCMWCTGFKLVGIRQLEKEFRHEV